MAKVSQFIEYKETQQKSKEFLDDIILANKPMVALVIFDLNKETHLACDLYKFRTILFSKNKAKILLEISSVINIETFFDQLNGMFFNDGIKHG